MLVYILFILGIGLIVKGADFFVKGSAALAKKLHMSNLMIGMTVLAMGTSLPELVVNINAALQGNADIALGNIIGSNMANIMLILGLIAVITTVALERSVLWREIPFSLISIVVIFILANDVFFNHASENIFSRADGLILLVFFGVFLYYLILLARRHDKTEDIEVKMYKNWQIAGLMLLGLVGLYLGGKWTVDGAVHIARLLKISEFVISATIIAIGTSLPELVTSVMAALRKNVGLAVGNIIGSNIFNAFFILGVTFFFHDTPFSAIANYDLLFLFISTLALFFFVFLDKKHEISRRNGIFFLLIYAGYLAFLFTIR
jgi:cation:H+ antiporter